MGKNRVLIVDDDREFLDELKELLAVTGYETLATDDSLSALEMARTERPDVILLDLNMNRLSGFRVAEILRRFPETAYTPIIGMTGYFSKDERSDSMAKSGIRVCLNKPFNELDVIGRIEMAIG